jgi:hypothetical protein
MVRKFGKVLGTLAFALKSLAAWAGADVSGAPDSFVFHDPGYYAQVPITVYYYKATGADADSQVRQPAEHRTTGGQLQQPRRNGAAERHNLIVIAPEFDRPHFPSRLYQLGGTEQHDRTRWTFAIIENIFAQLRREQKLNANSYILFGHSAGGHFVHRFMLMMDKPRVSVAVAANAGGYLWPAYAASGSDARLPWMLDKNLVGTEQLKRAFGRKLIVLLGDQDLQTGGPNFPHSREAQSQGATRLERGRNFFAQAQSEADKLGAAFGWRLETVRGIGHDAKGRAKAAEQLLF